MSSHDALISDEDLFKLLKLRYDTHFSAYKKSGKKVDTGLFNETIYHIELLESSLIQIENKASYSRADFDSAVTKSDESELINIINFFENLRVNLELLKAARANFILSHRIRNFTFCIDKIDDASFFFKGDRAWTIDSFPKEKVFDCIDEYQVFITTDIRMVDRGYEILVNNSLKSFTQFDDLLNKAKKVYPVFFDIEIFSTEGDGRKAADQINKKFDRLYDFFDNILGVFPALLSSYFNIEIGLNGSIKLDVVLIFQLSQHFTVSSEVVIGERIKNILIRDFNLSPNLRNLSNDDSPESTIKDVGQIIRVVNLKEIYRKVNPDKPVLVEMKSTSKKAIKNFKYWVLSYLFLKRKFFSPDLSLYNETRVYKLFGNRTQYREYAKPIAQERANESGTTDALVNALKMGRLLKLERIRKFSQLDIYQERKGLWSHSSYPKASKEYLNLMELIYKEQASTKRWPPSILETVIRIEIFMLTIGQSKQEAFHFGGRQLEDIKQNPEKFMNNFTEQFLFLIKAMEKFRLRYFMASTIFSWRISVFNNFHERIKDKNPLDFFMDETGITDLVKLLEDFKLALTKEKLKDEIIKRAMVKKNQDSALTYLSNILKQDALVIRFNLYTEFNDKNDHTQAFSALLTDFIKNLNRRPRKIGGHLIGHIGSYLCTYSPSVELIFIFDASKLHVAEDDIAENIKTYWETYVLQKQKNIDKAIVASKEIRAHDPTKSFLYMEELKKANLKATQNLVMASVVELSYMHLTIHAKDHLLKKLFVKSVTPYLTGLSLMHSNQQSNLSPKHKFLKGKLKKIEKAPEKKSALEVTVSCD